MALPWEHKLCVFVVVQEVALNSRRRRSIWLCRTDTKYGRSWWRIKLQIVILIARTNLYYQKVPHLVRAQFEKLAFSHVKTYSKSVQFVLTLRSCSSEICKRSLRHLPSCCSAYEWLRKVPGSASTFNPNAKLILSLVGYWLPPQVVRKKGSNGPEGLNPRAQHKLRGYDVCVVQHLLRERVWSKSLLLRSMKAS